MKKIRFIFLTLLLGGYCYSQNNVSDFVEKERMESANQNQIESDAVLEQEVMEQDVLEQDALEVENHEVEPIEATKPGVSEIPSPKRPLPIDEKKALLAAQKDETLESEENYRNTIKYGIPSEIASLIDELIENEDPRFTEEMYDVFQVTKNATIKEKILTYFTKQKDPCLEDFAVEILNDPYDQKNELVSAVFKYVSEVKTEEAIPAVVTLIESENENYFNAAITTLGDIGGPKEALFLAEYLDRDDLSDAQRQALMRTCGKMHAVETWDKLASILENEDENTFVRMYAAESLGLMKVEKSVPILIEQFDALDPNLRQYVIKGLVNYPDVVEAKSTILQGIRDEHWKVRQESIKAVKEINLTEAVDFLIYRAKNDSEKLIKEESASAIAKLNTQKGNEFLVNQITEKKTGDSMKKKIVEVLLKEGHAGEKEILDLAVECLNDDRRKDMRYAIGKELSKNYKTSYDKVALLYLQSKDSTTVGIGLDMYKNSKSEGLVSQVEAIAKEKKKTANKTRARKLLNLPEEDENESKSDKETKVKDKEKSEKINDLK